MREELGVKSGVWRVESGVKGFFAACVSYVFFKRSVARKAQRLKLWALCRRLASLRAPTQMLQGTKGRQSLSAAMFASVCGIDFGNSRNRFSQSANLSSWLCRDGLSWTLLSRTRRKCHQMLSGRRGACKKFYFTLGRNSRSEFLRSGQIFYKVSDIRCPFDCTTVWLCTWQKVFAFPTPHS